MILPRRVSVVIIGAGQAGLAVSYYLQRLGLRSGIDQLVVDRAPAPGGAWQYRWESLRLGTAHHVHDLPGASRAGLAFDEEDRGRPARDVVVDYYGRYERYFGLDVRRPVAVRTVEDAAPLLLVRTDAGDVHADAIVNATGTWGAPFVPYYPGIREFKGTQLHTANWVAADRFAGKRVLVVGGGTSAIGFLLDLEDVAERTIWVTRRPVGFTESGQLDLETATQAVAMQDAAARNGLALPSIVRGTGVPRTRRIATAVDRGVLAARPMFDHLEEHAAVWPTGDREEIDAIVWATGFRPEVRHLAPLHLHEAGGGLAVVDGVSARDDRVFFAGYGPAASTVGSNRAGRSVARQVFSAVALKSPPTWNGDAAHIEADPTSQVSALMARFFSKV